MTHNPLRSKPMVIIPDRPKPTKAQKTAAWSRENGICYWCLKPVAAAGNGIEYDHKLKRGVSADDSEANLFPMHVRCHREKTDGPDAKLQTKVRGQERTTEAKRQTSRGFRGWRNFKGEIVWRDDRS